MTEGAVQHPATTYTGVAEPRRARRLRVSPRLRWQVFQLGCDLLTVFVAANAAYRFYLVSGIGRQYYDPLVYLQLGAIFSCITVFALHANGAYRDELGMLRIEAVRRILRGVFSGVLLTLGLTFLVRFPSISRLNFLLLGTLSVLALVTQRFLLWQRQDRAVIWV